MKKEYNIEGMSCQGCVKRVQSAVEQIPEIRVIHVQLESPQLSIESESIIYTPRLAQALGKYSISDITIPDTQVEEISSTGFIETYKPLLLIIFFILMTTFLVQYPFIDLDGMLWMRHFMAGFFIVFAFFKFLNIKGFADSYMMYDIIAARWYSWGLIYPFVELGLGILYLINIAPILTNIATIIILGLSSIGVILSNIHKRKIQCACLGDVFNLPMSTVTIIEDLAMVGMAMVMLIIN